MLTFLCILMCLCVKKLQPSILSFFYFLFFAVVRIFSPFQRWFFSPPNTCFVFFSSYLWIPIRTAAFICSFHMDKRKGRVSGGGFALINGALFISVCVITTGMLTSTLDSSGTIENRSEHLRVLPGAAAFRFSVDARVDGRVLDRLWGFSVRMRLCVNILPPGPQRESTGEQLCLYWSKRRRKNKGDWEEEVHVVTCSIPYATCRSEAPWCIQGVIKHMMWPPTLHPRSHHKGPEICETVSREDVTQQPWQPDTKLSWADNISFGLSITLISIFKVNSRRGGTAVPVGLPCESLLWGVYFVHFTRWSFCRRIIESTFFLSLSVCFSLLSCVQAAVWDCSGGDRKEKVTEEQWCCCLHNQRLTNMHTCAHTHMCTDMHAGSNCQSRTNTLTYSDMYSQSRIRGSHWLSHHTLTGTFSLTHTDTQTHTHKGKGYLQETGVCVACVMGQSEQHLCVSVIYL